METSEGCFLPPGSNQILGMDGWACGQKWSDTHSGATWLLLLRREAQGRAWWMECGMICESHRIWSVTPLMNDIGLEELDSECQMWNFKKMNLTLSGRFWPGQNKGPELSPLSLPSACFCSIPLPENLLGICWSSITDSEFWLLCASPGHSTVFCPSSISNYLESKEFIVKML